jgi:hypothetical protein
LLEVKYEDVVADLEGQARRIVGHCGLEWDARCLAFHQTSRPVRTASAVQVRQPIYNESVGRWRRYESFLGPLQSPDCNKGRMQRGAQRFANWSCRRRPLTHHPKRRERKIFTRMPSGFSGNSAAKNVDQDAGRAQ